jgi:predicted component of type VI protein secretion system
MENTVDVMIPVEPEAAAALADTRNREAVGRLISRVLNPRSGPSPLAQAMAQLKAEVRQAGLTDAEIDAELDAYNAERRDRPTAI